MHFQKWKSYSLLQVLYQHMRENTKNYKNAAQKLPSKPKFTEEIAKFNQN